MTNDHTRERAEDLHAAEEAVTVAVDRLSKAETDVIAWAKRLYRASGAGCDDALRGLQLMVHRLDVAEKAHEDAVLDRDRASR